MQYFQGIFINQQTLINHMFLFKYSNSLKYEQSAEIQKHPQMSDYLLAPGGVIYLSLFFL